MSHNNCLQISKNSKLLLQKSIFSLSRNKWYIPTQPIIFKNHLSPIIKSSHNSIIYLGEILFSLISFSTFFKGISSLVKFKLTKSFLWFSSCFYSTKYLMGATFNKRFFINGMSLYDCGTRVRIKTQSNIVNECDIKNIRKLSIMEKKFFYSLPVFSKKNLIPLIIDDRIFLARKSLIFVNKEIFWAILDGKKIKLKKKKLEKDSIINI